MPLLPKSWQNSFSVYKSWSLLSPRVKLYVKRVGILLSGAYVLRRYHENRNDELMYRVTNYDLWKQNRLYESDLQKKYKMSMNSIRINEDILIEAMHNVDPENEDQVFRLFNYYTTDITPVLKNGYYHFDYDASTWEIARCAPYQNVLLDDCSRAKIFAFLTAERIGIMAKTDVDGREEKLSDSVDRILFNYYEFSKYLSDIKPCESCLITKDMGAALKNKAIELRAECRERKNV